MSAERQVPLPSDVRSRVRFCDRVDDIRRFRKSYRRPPTRSVDEVCFLVVAEQEGYGRRHAI